MNDNDLQIPNYQQIGYVTKAGLVYVGTSIDKKQHLYTTKTHLGVMKLKEAQSKINELNRDGEFKKEYGFARLPTVTSMYDKHFSTKGRLSVVQSSAREISTFNNEIYHNFYKNRNLIGGFETNSFMLARKIWGSNSYRQQNILDFSDIYSCEASDEAALRPMWAVDSPVV